MTPSPRSSVSNGASEIVGVSVFAPSLYAHVIPVPFCIRALTRSSTRSFVKYRLTPSAKFVVENGASETSPRTVFAPRIVHEIPVPSRMLIVVNTWIDAGSENTVFPAPSVVKINPSEPSAAGKVYSPAMVTVSASRVPYTFKSVYAALFVIRYLFFIQLA